MLFPARDIANEFWAFVLDLALDPRLGDFDPRSSFDPLPARSHSETLNQLEGRRSELRVQLAGPNAHQKWAEPGSDAEFWRFYDLERTNPWGYRTLQDALVAFLIDLAARNRLNFSLSVWRCTVPVILADAIRDPDRLQIILREVDNAGAAEASIDDPAYQTTYTMALSDDWSCLSSQTFNHIVTTYTGKG